MCSTNMQGGMKSAISADESTTPDASRAVPFVLIPPLVSELWASGIRHYYQSSPSLTKRHSYMQGDTKLIITPNERTMSADSKCMLFVPDTLLGLGAIVA